ncbi:hypothetical protein BJV74DRAFT_987283 [Russula compacta]|nr:hypothetical protein BJV74DRAFT_987283 [Russula compacta]
MSNWELRDRYWSLGSASVEGPKNSNGKVMGQRLVMSCRRAAKASFDTDIQRHLREAHGRRSKAFWMVGTPGRRATTVVRFESLRPSYSLPDVPLGQQWIDSASRVAAHQASGLNIIFRGMLATFEGISSDCSAEQRYIGVVGVLRVLRDGIVWSTRVTIGGVI